MKQFKPYPVKQYKTTNWSEYNAALQARGNLCVWLDPQMQCGMPLRQTLGFVKSLLKLAQLDWQVPDISTLKIRAIDVTDNSIGDAPMLESLLDQIPMMSR